MVAVLLLYEFVTLFFFFSLSSSDTLSYLPIRMSSVGFCLSLTFFWDIVEVSPIMTATQCCPFRLFPPQICHKTSLLWGGRFPLQMESELVSALPSNIPIGRHRTYFSVHTFWYLSIGITTSLSSQH